MADKPKPGSYIDTQGMSGPTDPNAKSSGNVEYKPAITKPRRILTSTDVMELKILIHEVLDEREGKGGISYFDTEHFKHFVGEPEPHYEEWK
jgi:hypothetical protein